MENSGSATFSFQAEIKQLLRLMVHSLYSNREIFLRELISNASDANDRLRFEALASPALLAGTELEIRVSIDKDARRLSVTDNGIGMRPETVDKLLVGPVQSDSYGLKNVDDRIKLRYGDEYGIQIGSVYGGGTTVLIRLPANAGGLADSDEA